MTPQELHGLVVTDALLKDRCQALEKMTAARDRLRDALADAVELLAAMEWSGPDNECLLCEGTYNHHHPECELDKFLRRVE